MLNNGSASLTIPVNSHIIVLGNEKGGTGKSTTAMHIVVSLLERQFRVAVIDLDPRQKTLTRYLENRHRYAETNDLPIPLPCNHVLPKSTLRNIDDAELDERTRLNRLIMQLDSEQNFIVIDCAGSDSFLARLAQSHADTLVTPVNDSFIDLDLLGHVNSDTYQVEKLSLYSEAVWDSRQQRALSGRRGLDWVILRNRVTAVNAYNKQRVDKALKQLQKRIVFRYIPGLTERVIYRELFPRGLTLVDYKQAFDRKSLTMSHLAARQELRRLMENLHLPGWE